MIHFDMHRTPTHSYMREHLDLPATVRARVQELPFTEEHIDGFDRLAADTSPAGISRLSNLKDALIADWNREWWGIYRFWI